MAQLTATGRPSLAFSMTVFTWRGGEGGGGGEEGSPQPLKPRVRAVGTAPEKGMRPRVTQGCQDPRGRRTGGWDRVTLGGGRGGGGGEGKGGLAMPTFSDWLLESRRRERGRATFSRMDGIAHGD